MLLIDTSLDTQISEYSTNKKSIGSCTPNPHVINLLFTNYVMSYTERCCLQSVLIIFNSAFKPRERLQYILNLKSNPKQQKI